MDIDRATEILSSLADGTDPFTGEILPDDSVYNRAETVRAFYCILNELKLRKTKATKELPKNAGMPWTEEDDTVLAELFAEGTKTRALAEHFGRTEGAIVSRLKRLGIISY